MTEKLLQYIWQFRLFRQQQLTTLDGQAVQVLSVGTLNKNQGPDFLNAKITIGNTIWAGSVELHLFTSQWKAHGHTGDPNYANVILHVVWQHDATLDLNFPTLVLEPHIARTMEDTYEQMMHNVQFVPCESFLPAIRNISLIAWKERLLVERMEYKYRHISELLQAGQYHWEEICWWLIARNFGAPVNSDAFEAMARSIPVQVLGRQKHQLLQLEALMFGQAGILEQAYADAYPLMLQKEFRYLKAKYKLPETDCRVQHLRMRPADFPEVRLAQLAAMVSGSAHIFATILEAEHLNEVEKIFQSTANDYWHYHYKFDEASGFKEKNTGREFTRRLCINAVVPLLFAYGLHNKLDKYQQKALRWMEQLGPEKNNITRGFASLGIQNKSAYDSQALIHLKNEYCNPRKCLQCAIGHMILNPR